MNYTKGKWTPTAFSVTVNCKPILELVIGDSNDNIPATELQNNTEILCSAVNGCISINPENPLAVAESIKDLYEALKAILPSHTGYMESMNWRVYNEVILQIRQVLAKVEGRE